MFATDLEKYKNERGFHISIEDTGFPVCDSNEKLYNEILNMNSNKSEVICSEFRKRMGSYEDGTAAKQICEYINQAVKGD